MFWLLIFGLSISLLILLRKKIATNIKSFLWSLKIPGPIALPILGNGYKFFCHKDEIFNRIRQIFVDFTDPIIRIWLGPKLVVIIKHPPYLQKILQSSMTEKDSLMDVAKPFLGEGLITGSGPMWKAHRKLILPALGAKAVEEYCTVFHREAEIMVNKMVKHAENHPGKAIKLEDYFQPCAIDIVCDTVIDYKLNAQNSLNQEFVEALDMLYFILYERMVKPWLFSDILFAISPLGGVQKKTLKILRSFVLDIIQRRRDQRQTKLVENVINSKLDYRDKFFNYDEDMESDIDQPLDDMRMNTSLDLLLEAQESKTMNITDKELIDEILTLFMASSDTIASIGAFCLKMLAMNPEYQEKVIEEFTRVTAIHGDNLTSSALSELVYLERCIKDTIRLFPIGPFIVRINRSEFKLDESITIPSGVTVMMALYIAHTDPKNWSHPNEFYPDHFLPEEVEKRHPYAYVPFSGGLRSCIGKVYAMISVKIMVVKVLQNLRLSSIPGENCVKDLDLVSDISVRVKGGNHVIMKKI